MRARALYLVWLGTAAPAALAASLSGSVSGPDGARLVAARIALTARDGGVTRGAVTNGQGLFYLAGLPAGRYEIAVAAPHFASARESDLILAADESRQIELTLGATTRFELIDVLAPASRESVAADKLRECPAPDLGQALDGEPGIARTRRGALGSDLVLRGMPGRNVTVLVDGQGLCPACPNRMDPPVFHVDFAEVDRVEIVRGPFDVKNMGGLGGTVNVITRRPGPGIEIEPAMSYGAAGAANPSLAASWGGKKVSALGGVSYREARPYRDGDGQRVTEHAGYRSDARASDAYRVGTAWGRVFHHDERGLVQLAYTRQRADHVLYPTLMMDAIKDDTDRVQFLWETAHTKTQVGYARVDHWMTDELRASATAAARAYSMATQARARTFGARFNREKGDLKLGAEIGRRDWDARAELAARAYAPQAALAAATTDTLGAFALVEHDVNLALSLSAGVRLDRALSRVDEAPGNLDLFEAYHATRERRRGDWLPAGSLKATWRHGRSQLSLSLGHAARPPEPTERFYALRRAGADWVGNPRLAPSRTSGAELAYRIEAARVRVVGALFASHVADYVTVADQARQRDVPGVSNTLARTWANVDATFLGAETQLSLIVTSRVFVDAGLSTVRGSQRPDSASGLHSTRLPEMPAATGRVALRYDDARIWVKLETLLASRQTRVNSDLREEETPGYGVINAAAGLRLGGARVTLGAANVFDRYYVEHLSYQRDPFRSGLRLPEPGRTLYAHATMRFGSRRP
jgi:iron complex outermembrane recepter protein